MEEKNPLEIHIADVPKKSLQSNKSGRPMLSKVINFTAQPKSIISKLLNKVTEDNGSEEKNHFEISTESSSLNTDCEDQPQVINTYEDVHGSFTLHLVRTEDSHEYNDLKESYSLLNKNQTNLNNDNKKEVQLPEVTCYVCSHRSSNYITHREHMRIHRNQPYKCNFPECGYETKLSSNLIKHKRIHTSEKPYLCDQCTFRSNYVNSLKVHKRTHTSERPYGCQYCSYRGNSSSNLKKHCLRRHRKPPDQSTYP